MSKPTLMIRGNLVQFDADAEKQADLDTNVPYEYILEWFETRLQKTGIENRVLILKSMTASGKSVLLPPEIFKKFINNKPASGSGLICTQPRRITAINNVLDMLQYNPFLKLGENSGWSTMYDQLKPTISACLFSATLQTLTQMLKTLTDEEICAKYQFIMLDETHERSIALDLTVNILKNFILRNANKVNCPFVCLMSATFDESVFLKYFNVPIATNYICVKGLTAPRDYRYIFANAETSRNLNSDIAKTIETITRVGEADIVGQRDVIVFLPSGNNPDLRKMLDTINSDLLASGKESQLFAIIQISSEAQEFQTAEFLALDNIPLSSQEVVIDGKIYKPSRRVILSTNVAETGLTLNELKYIIDSGFDNKTEFNPVLGISYLIKKAAAQSNINQRIGRVGRKFAGVYYPMYPKAIFDKLQVNQYPSILVDDFTESLLDFIIEQLKQKQKDGVKIAFSIADLDMLDVPAPDSLIYSMEKLYMLGFISPLAPEWSSDDTLFFEDKTEQTPRLSITKSGVIASRIMCPSINSLESIRMIIAGFTWNASVIDLITIATYISHTRDLKHKLHPINWEYLYETGLPNFTASARAYFKMKQIIGDQFIEGLILFNSFSRACVGEKIDNINKWYELSGVNNIGMVKHFLPARDNIIEQLLGTQIDVFKNEEYAYENIIDARGFLSVITNLKHCIYDGYRAKSVILTNSKYVAINGVSLEDPKFIHEDKRKMVDLGLDEMFLEKPRRLVCYNFGLSRPKRGESAQKIEMGLISILDNYVATDDAFNI
jgi:hypothetical protein